MCYLRYHYGTSQFALHNVLARFVWLGTINSSFLPRNGVHQLVEHLEIHKGTLMKLSFTGQQFREACSYLLGWADVIEGTAHYRQCSLAINAFLVC
jgi:hypothetical protein